MNPRLLRPQIELSGVNIPTTAIQDFRTCYNPTVPPLVKEGLKPLNNETRAHLGQYHSITMQDSKTCYIPFVPSRPLTQGSKRP